MLRTRLTERFDLDHPIILAPMGSVAGGRLAAAVSKAGGLGLLGGGYGDERWLQEQLAAAGSQRIGCGFITWSRGRRGTRCARSGVPRPIAGMARSQSSALSLSQRPRATQTPSREAMPET